MRHSERQRHMEERDTETHTERQRHTRRERERHAQRDRDRHRESERERGGTGEEELPAKLVFFPFTNRERSTYATNHPLVSESKTSGSP